MHKKEDILRVLKSAIEKIESGEDCLKEFSTSVGIGVGIEHKAKLQTGDFESVNVSWIEKVDWNKKL